MSIWIMDILKLPYVFYMDLANNTANLCPPYTYTVFDYHHGKYQIPEEIYSGNVWISMTSSPFFQFSSKGHTVKHL